MGFSVKKTILIVENDVVLARRFQNILGAREYEISGLATTLEDALAAVKNDPPGLILLDLGLPGAGDAITTAQYIKAGHEIPIIFLTDHPPSPPKQKARLPASDSFLLKPVPENELLVTLELVFQRHNLKQDLIKSRAALQKAKVQLQLQDEINHIFLTEPGDAMFKKVLEIICREMQSPYGFFGYLDDQKKLICKSVATGIQDNLQVQNKTFVVEENQWFWAWGTNLLAKKPVFKNKGLSVPQEHIKIERALSVPLIYQGELVGHFGVANKESDYRKKDVRHLEDLATHTAAFLFSRLQRDQKEEKRRQSEEQTRLLANLLTLLNKPNDTRRTLREIVTLIKHQTRLEAVGIRLKEGEDFPFFYTKGHSEEFIETEKHLCINDEEGQPLRDGSGTLTLECLCGHVLRGKIDPSQPCFSEGGSFWSNETTALIAGLPPGMAHSLRFRGKCLQEGYESLAIIPLRSTSETVGLLHLADSEKNRFTEDKIRFFEIIGQSMGIALAREQAQKSLQENRSRLETTLKGVRAFVYDFSSKTNTARIFGGQKEMLGYDSREIIPNRKNWLKLLHPEDRKSFQKYLRKRTSGKETGNGYDFEYRLRKKNNGWLWVRDQGQVLTWGKGGRPLITQGVVTDIQRSKEAEERLRSSEATYRALFNNMEYAIAIYDLENFTLIDVNQSYLDLFGFAPEEIMRTKRSNVFSEVNDIGEAECDKIMKQVLNGENVRLEKQDAKKAGEIFWAEKRFGKVNLNGLDYLMVTTRDITELKMMRETMIQTEKMISLGGLAAGMAHEINNPLSIIMQGAQNILRRTREKIPANLKTAKDCELPFEGLTKYFEKRNINRSLEAILEASNRASNIVGNMLDFSRQEAPAIEMKDINAILERAIALAQTDYDLTKKFDFSHIDIQKVFSELPPVPCVETEMEQVFLNLLKNSAQSLHQANRKSPVIHICTKLTSKTVRIDIEDNGTGVSPEHRNRIFEPFFTTKESGVGTGLGLSVSYYIIVHRHQGRFQMESEPGKWTHFTINLPLATNMSSSILESG
jgi:PAS domain S-box-containing protein